MSTNESSGLNRSIGLVHATAMVAGTIIGASIFVQPSEISAHIPSIAGVFIVWFLAGAITLAGALCCAELASIFPQSGGVYVYLREIYGKPTGFLWGWAMFWCMQSGVIALVAMIFARYVGYFIPLDDMGTKLVAVAGLSILSGINYLGVKQGSVVLSAITIGKIFAILAIIVLGFFLGSQIPEHFVTTSGVISEEITSSVTGDGFVLALIAGLFAFGGWHMVTFSAEETVDPQKTIPKSLFIGTALVTVCYLALNAVYMYILPLDVISASHRVAADGADAIFGGGGGAMMSGLVIFSTFGAMNGAILSGPRVYFAMARDGLMFKWAAGIHPKFKTPHRAILLQALWAIVLVLTGTYRTLFVMVIYVQWIFFIAMTIGIFILRKRGGLERQYSVPGYPVVPLLFIIPSIVIILSQIINDPVNSMIGLGLVLVGLPVYYLTVNNKTG